MRYHNGPKRSVIPTHASLTLEKCMGRDADGKVGEICSGMPLDDDALNASCR